MVQKFVFTTSGELPSFNSHSNEIFFNYPVWISVMLLIISIIATVFLFLSTYFKGVLRPRKVLGIFIITVSAFFIFVFLGTLIAYMVSVIYGERFNILYPTNVPNVELVLLGVLIMAAISSTVAISKFMGEDASALEQVVGGIIINLLISISFGIFLPGMAFLCILPTFL